MSDFPKLGPSYFPLLFLILASLILSGCMAEALEVIAESSVEGGASIAGGAAEVGTEVIGAEATSDAFAARGVVPAIAESAESLDAVTTIREGKITGPLNIDALGRVSIQGSNRLLVDWQTGLIEDMSTGRMVAKIEGNTIYAITDSWGHVQPIAEVFLRILKTGTHVEVVAVNAGWFELRLSDGALGWTFAPVFMTRYSFKDRSNTEKVGRYYTKPHEVDFLNSIINDSQRVREDIHQLLPGK
jgi:hypothetical protein